jgi:hypothetical protein
MAGKFTAGGITALLVIGFGLITLCLYYCLALMTINKTHIRLDDEKIQVSRHPLPNLLAQSNEIGLAGIASITYEETSASKKEGYDTPRYRVWAETADGRRKLIVNDVIEDYALFISQSLNARLEAGPDISRLIDQEEEAEAQSSADDFTRQSRKADSNQAR